MNELEILALNATKDILEKNLKIYDERVKDKKVVLVYDLESKLSTFVANWYIENLKNNKNAIIININDIEKENLKVMLLSLEKFSMVILVQSTNFRLDEFRLRLNLKNSNIGCIEHNHLIYMKDKEIQTYLKAISYKWEFFEKLSNNLKNLFDNGRSLEIIWKEWNIFKVTEGFEDMKQNTWNFEIENRYGTYPVWENFTESKDFLKVNWELLIKAYPWMDMKVHILEKPFKIVIKESIVTEVFDAPEIFIEVFEKIKAAEWEVMIRELWFWLNPDIDFENSLSDVNPFERYEGFHLSLGKKHNIYRKKLHKDVVQRYHIDIFPEFSEIKVDWELIYKDWRFVV
jgi:aminopeptidase